MLPDPIISYRQRLIMCLILLVAAGTLYAQDAPEAHGKRWKKLKITNVMMVDGIGTPAEGPVDVVIENDRIKRIYKSGKTVTSQDVFDMELDGSGKYLLPGFINMHGHMMNTRAGQAMPFQYQFNLWLGAGITTIRDLGSNPMTALNNRNESRKNIVPAPRMFLYMILSGANSEREIRNKIGEFKRLGADGVKLIMLDRHDFRIAAGEAKKQGLKIAHHVGVEDATAWDDIEMRTTTIEHWYGVPDAALKRVQSFPPDFNHNNELHRFRYAGRLWREADPDLLQAVLENLVDASVAWDPTFCIYEACRDLQRAITQPWFDDYLHPALEAFFTPNPEYHGSFFFGWTNSDEVYWKENYRIWMKAVRTFADLGGTVTTGEDAGFIYQMFGFGYLRELELHEEAGFHPLEVIKHATHNGARVLGKGNELGRIKAGYLADMVLVNGNPLENLHVLFPKGINHTLDQQRGDAGGIEWTIKDGIPYHAPTLLREVREIVKAARAQKASSDQ